MHETFYSGYFRLVDAANGACTLKAVNLISNRSSILAKVELLRLRALVNCAERHTREEAERIVTEMPKIYLCALEQRKGNELSRFS